MAVIKAVSSSGSIAAAIRYVTKTEKTDVKLLSGIDCAPETARQEMQTTKEFWGKKDGRSYLSFVQSFHKDEKISPQQAHEIGIRLAEKLSGEEKPWAGHEILIGTHIDRGHIHTHFIVNSVNLETGHKIQFSKSDLAAMKQWSDDLCREYGLTITKKGKTFHGKDLTVDQPSTYSKEAQYIMDQAKAGNIDSYVMEIAKAAIEVRSKAVSREDFCQQMEELGYAVNWSDTRKNITFTDMAREMHGEKKCKVRDSNLEKTFPALQFGKESFTVAFEKNAAEQELAATKEPQKAPKASPAAQEPEPERTIRVVPTPPEKPSEKLRTAFEDLKAAHEDVGKALTALSLANKGWGKKKKEAAAAASQALSAAQEKRQDAFDRVVSFGVSAYRDGVQLRAASLDSDDLNYLERRVDWVINDMEQSEIFEAQPDRKKSLDDQMAGAQEVQQKQISRQPEKTTIQKSSHEDR